MSKLDKKARQLLNVYTSCTINIERQIFHKILSNYICSRRRNTMKKINKENLDYVVNVHSICIWQELVLLTYKEFLQLNNKFKRVNQLKMDKITRYFIKEGIVNKDKKIYSTLLVMREMQINIPVSYCYRRNQAPS